MENVIINFIPQELFIVGVVLFVLGNIIKASKVPDQYILFILLTAGIIFALAKNGFNVDSIMYGIILTMVPVLGQNAIKQIQEIVNKK